MALDKVGRTVVRHCLRRARQFDRDPVLKALITRNTLEDLPQPLDSIVAQFLGGPDRRNYWPAAGGDAGSDSVVGAVKDAVRNPPPGVTADAGFQGIRYLTALLSVAERHKVLEHCSAATGAGEGSASTSVGRTSEEPLQQSLQQQQQQPAAPQLCSQPGKGVLLVSHPSLGGWFKRAVVLLCQHDAQLGAYGLCLNKRLGATVRDLTDKIRELKGGGAAEDSAGARLVGSLAELVMAAPLQLKPPTLAAPSAPPPPFDLASVLLQTVADTAGMLEEEATESCQQLLSMAAEEGKGTLLGDAAALLAAARAQNAPALAAVPAPLLRDRIADVLADMLEGDEGDLDGALGALPLQGVLSDSEGDEGLVLASGDGLSEDDDGDAWVGLGPSDPEDTVVMGAVVVETPFGLRIEPLPPYLPSWGAAAGSAARAAASGSAMPGGGAAARLLETFKGLALAARAEPAAAAGRAASDPRQPSLLAPLSPPQPTAAAAAASDSSSAAGAAAAGCQAARSGGSEPSEQAGGSGSGTAGGEPGTGATLGGSGFAGSGWAADPESAAWGDGEQRLTLGQVLALFEDSELFRGGPVEGLQLLHRSPEFGGETVLPAQQAQHAQQQQQQQPSGEVGEEGAGAAGLVPAPGALFVGARLRDAPALVQQGQLSARDVKVFIGDCGWFGGQVEGELASGTWAMVRADEEVMAIFEQQQGQPQAQQQGQHAQQQQPQQPQQAQRQQDLQQQLSDQQPREDGRGLWQRLLAGLGPQHAAMARIPEGVWQDLMQVRV